MNRISFRILEETGDISCRIRTQSVPRTDGPVGVVSAGRTVLWPAVNRPVFGDYRKIRLRRIYGVISESNPERDSMPGSSRYISIKMSVESPFSVRRHFRSVV